MIVNFEVTTFGQTCILLLLLVLMFVGAVVVVNGLCDASGDIYDVIKRWWVSKH